MTPLPDDQRQTVQTTRRSYKFWLTLACLITGAGLLVIGGKEGDAVTQTAGGTIIAAVVGVLGYRRLSGGDS